MQIDMQIEPQISQNMFLTPQIRCWTFHIPLLLLVLSVPVPPSDSVGNLVTKPFLKERIFENFETFYRYFACLLFMRFYT